IWETLIRWTITLKMLKFSLWLLLIILANQVLSRPNFVLIFADDVGYGDFQSYGHPTQERGPIDDLAAEGMRFTQWYSAASLCTPSRAALLTGRLPIHSGMVGPTRVLHQNDAGGLPKNETTLAEALKELGYKTGMVGKWHLGINELKQNDGRHLPKHHGFDFVGTNLPFTFHLFCSPSETHYKSSVTNTKIVKIPAKHISVFLGGTLAKLCLIELLWNLIHIVVTTNMLLNPNQQYVPKYPVDKMKIKCFLSNKDEIIEQPIIPEKLTDKIVEGAKQFITENQKNPFFLYLSLPQTHVAMFCKEEFCNKSMRGSYGDNVNEMSWAVGEVVNQLKDLNLDQNTLVMFLSDHGPAVEFCYTGGSTGGLKGGKASSWDGGIKVPAVAWWPGTIQPGVKTQVVSTMDIFPTFLQLAGNEGNNGNLDGMSISDLLLSNHDNEVHEILFHYCSDRLMAVRYGRYKIHFHTQHLHVFNSNCIDGKALENIVDYFDCYANTTTHNPPLIFDINTDPEELFPLEAAPRAHIIEEVEKQVAKHQKTIKPVASQLGRHGKDLQPCCNPPSCVCNYPNPDKRKTEL
uniref:Sulfatase N-terminal domain-containing protein n=1 Tax=Ciona intestinalis TaxID=7719 RepID=H2XRT9_CIOIN